MWKGQLEFVLPKRKRLTRGHHAALPYRELPDFMEKLAQQETLAASAPKFTILMAARTSEALFAQWEEFDFERALWTIPAARMKAGKEHGVLLPGAVVDLLHSWEQGAGPVFSY